MKKKIIVFTMALLSALMIIAQDEANMGLPIIGPADNLQLQSEWINLKRGEGIFDFIFSDKLLFKGKEFTGAISNERYEQVSISPMSDNGKYIICITYDEYFDWSGLYICNLENMDTYSLRIANPMLWLSWSPNDKNVLLANYYEADMKIYCIGLPSLTITELDFSADLKKENGYPMEEMQFDLESMTWITQDTVEIRGNINCNPYNDEKCDEEARSVILRSYQYTYDITHHVILKKLTMK